MINVKYGFCPGQKVNICHSENEGEYVNGKIKEVKFPKGQKTSIATFISDDKKIEMNISEANIDYILGDTIYLK